MRARELDRLWKEQGRPVDQPVVVDVGWLVVRESGRRHICNWGLWVGRLETPWPEQGENLDQDTFDRLWEYLALRYPDTIRWVTEDTWLNMNL